MLTSKVTPRRLRILLDQVVQGQFLPTSALVIVVYQALSNTPLNIRQHTYYVDCSALKLSVGVGLVHQELVMALLG